LRNPSSNPLLPELFPLCSGYLWQSFNSLEKIHVISSPHTSDFSTR
jgi:hypothetical protein